MADNTTITPGSGITVRTDELPSGAHVQYVKLMSGAADSVEVIEGSAANGLEVDVTRMPTGSNAAPVQGSVAHGSPASNNPIVGGAQAISAEPTAVSDGDVSKLITDLVGKLITMPYANPENFISGVTAAIVDTTRTQVIAAQSAGIRTYVTHLIVTNSHASVGTLVTIENGTTALYRGYAAPMGGGFSIVFPTPIKTSAATALNVSCETTCANVYVSASGYKGI